MDIKSDVHDEDDKWNAGTENKLWMVVTLKPNAEV